MEKLEPLNFGLHRDVRMKPVSAPMHFVQIFGSEFANAATRCPILFTKNAATGSFYVGALFGFKPGECVGESTRTGDFRPLVMQCEGFRLQGANIAIDRAHARFGGVDGEMLFADSGEPAPALRQIQQALGAVHSGLQQTQSFIDTLSAARLIEQIDVNMTFADGERLNLQGLYTVSLDRLRDIDDPTALELFRAGHLQLAYIAAGSLRQLDRLARLRNSL